MDDERRVLPKVWVVRADRGSETQRCVDGGFIGIGWHEIGDLSDVADSAMVAEQWLSAAHRDDKASGIRATIGNISRFLFDIQVGDWVITPEDDRKWLRYGQVIGDYRYEASRRDHCPYRHRRDVLWSANKLARHSLSYALQNTLGGQLTVFRVRHQAEFFERIGFAVRRRFD